MLIKAISTNDTEKNKWYQLNTNTFSPTDWSFFTFHIYITNFAAFSVLRSAVDSFLTLHT